MKKMTKKIIFSLSALVVTLSTLVSTASAAYNYSTSYNFTSFFTNYTYKVYRDSSTYYSMFHSLDVCPAIYHSKNKGTTSLTYSTARTYTSQTAESFNSSIGISVPVSGVSASASTGYGITKTKSYSVAASGSVGRTIPSSAATGYYKMTICHNSYKFRLDKYKRNSSTKLSTSYMHLPYGNAYVSVLYGTSTQNSSYRKY